MSETTTDRGPAEAVEIEESTTPLDSITDRVERYRKAKALEKKAKDAAEEARGEIAAELEAHGAEYGTIGGALVIRWRPIESSRLDTKKLRESHPDIADAFTRPTVSMRMEIVE